MINILKPGKVLKPTDIKPARRYAGECENCGAEYSCSRDDINEGTIEFIRAHVIGEIDCLNQTCRSPVTMVKNRF